MNKDLTVYVLVRTDLNSLGSGKAIAQAHHAGVQLAAKYHNHRLVKEYIKLGIKEGADFFNTTLSVKATINDIKRIENQCKGIDCIFDKIIDPTYPFEIESEEVANLIKETKTLKRIKTNSTTGKVLFVREEVTLAYALGDRANLDFNSIFRSFELIPNKELE